jgi:hypothetical protein
MKTAILAIGLFILLPANALGFGEIFKVGTSGTKYYGDFDVTKFNASNNVDWWFEVISENEVLGSLTPDFAPGTTFPAIAHFYRITPTKAGFIVAALFEDNSFVTFVGTATFNRNGTITGAKGTFIQAGLLDPDCFSTGQAITGKRLN